MKTKNNSSLQLDSGSQIAGYPIMNPKCSEDTVVLLMATPSGSNVMGGKHSYIYCL
jgi:hypothetical protein